MFLAPADIVFYGGSFDPIHHGHITIARNLRNILKCQVVVVPVVNWMKNSGLFTLKERIELASLVFRREYLVKVVDWALYWQDMDSTEAFIRQYSESRPLDKRQKWIAMGSDALKYLPKWKNVQKLLPRVKFAIILRENSALDEEAMTMIGNQYRVIPHVSAISSSAIRNGEADWKKHTPPIIWTELEKKLSIATGSSPGLSLVLNSCTISPSSSIVTGPIH